MNSRITIDKSPQCINWVFTLNNPTQDELIILRSLVLSEKVAYICWGEEVGSEGTPHLQGYVELLNRQRLVGVKKILNSRCHFEPRRGTQQQAISYCKKDGVFVEFGTKKEQREVGLSEKDNLVQNRLLSIREKIKKGANEKEIYDDEPLMAARFPKYIDKCISWAKPPIRQELKVELHVGETASGKTHQAYHRYPDLWAAPIKCGNSLWFPGYSGEKVVLLDDFRGGITLDQLLRLLDKYPIQVETKGGFVWFNPDLIIITSNFSEDDWYDYHKREPHRAALKRRITHRALWKELRATACNADWIPNPIVVVLETPTESEESVEDDIVVHSQHSQEDLEELSEELLTSEDMAAWNNIKM